MPDIESVAVDPDHCHRCGTRVGTTTFEGRETPWCPNCELILSRTPVPGVHVVVHDADSVLLLDEPIPQHEGVLSLPGGFCKPDEGPEQALCRELEEETGLAADPAALQFVTVVHAALDGIAFYFLTYALPRDATTGSLSGEAAGFEAAFHPLEAVLEGSAPLRDNDRDRIAEAIETAPR